MDFFLKIAGSIASHNEKSSRLRHNGIGQDMQTLLGLLVLGLVCGVFYLSQGDFIALVGAVLSGLVSLFLAVVMGLQNTIFLKENLPQQVLHADDNLLKTKMRWSGDLRLDTKTKMRFMDVPVKANRLKDESFGVFANIDASSTIYGLTWNSRVGTWWSLPQANSLEMEVGRLYFGFQSAPSLRIKFVDKTDGKKSTAILSFDSLEARNAMYFWLSAEKAKTTLS